MNYADMIIQSNAVFTGTEREPFYGWIAVCGKRIKAVGRGMVPEGMIGEHTAVYQYKDQMVMAGFIDAHMHFGLGAAFKSRHYLDLSGTESEQDCINLIKAHLEQYPDLDHVLGWGWFLSNWDNSTPPDRASLDGEFPHIPLYLFCVDGHTCWVNTKAMEVCGISENRELSFGSFGVDDRGRLNGLL